MLRASSILIAIALFVAACATDDTGECCMAADPSIIPQPATNPSTGEPLTYAVTNLKFNCESATCVSYQGSPAFCTNACSSSGDCPDGLQCARMIVSDPGNN